MPGIHPGLQQKIKDAEEAEIRGESPKQYGGAQKITRPALSPNNLQRTKQARTIGLIESAYQSTQNFLLDLAKQTPFRPGENLDDIWDTLSEEQKVQAGATERFRLEFESTIANALPAWQPPHQIGGRLDARALERGQRNIENLIDAFDFLLAPDSYELLIRFNRENHALVDICLKQRTLQGIGALDMHTILEDWVKKLIYLEIVSRQRMQGDRGIRYVYGLIHHGEQLLKPFKAYPDFSPKERFCMRLIQVHQNIGLTAYAARASTRGSKLYRAYSARIFTDEINRYRQVLTHREAELIRTAIATQHLHEFPIKTARLLAIIRLAHILNPFNPFATHLRIQHIEDAQDYLEDMKERILRGNIEGFAEAQKSFHRFLLEDAKMSIPLSDDIIAAFHPFEQQNNSDKNIQISGTSGEIVFIESENTFKANIESQKFNANYDFLFALGHERLNLQDSIQETAPYCIPKSLDNAEDAALQLIPLESQNDQ